MTPPESKELFTFLLYGIQKQMSRCFNIFLLLKNLYFYDTILLGITVLNISTEVFYGCKEIDNTVIWNSSDRIYPERPSFYCLTITR